MKYKELLKKLYQLENKGTKFGLERVEKILKTVDNPHKKLKTIHVAGTNGKGSVCAMLRTILAEAGFKVGMYISPHLVHFNERITINGEVIHERDFMQLYNKIEKISKEIKATFFEIITAIAFQYFAEKKVDYAIIEVGLGGRLDATNVITPLVSVITNISLEHQNMLGSTIRDIAKEKAGIIKKGVPVVTMAHEEALTVIKTAASKLKSKVLIPTKEYDCSLAGQYQKWNASLAVTAFKQLKIKSSTEMIRKGLTRVEWPGRLQKIDNILLDCAHNPEATKALAHYVSEQTFDRLFLVFGALRDKDVKEMLKHLQPQATMTILTRPMYNRALGLKEISKHLKTYLMQERVENAVRFAKNMATEKDIILITGSCYVVGEALNALKKKQSYKRPKNLKPKYTQKHSKQRTGYRPRQKR